MTINRNRSRIALDMDTALEDEQWGKLKDFLSDKLPAEHMGVVEDICRRGGDAPEPGEDRKRPKGGASDSTLALDYDAVLDREASALHERHRAGQMSEGKLAQELYALRRRKRSTAAPMALDKKLFPNAARLKD